MIFDDVLIPWERVFLMRKPKEANALFRTRVMSWAGYASVLQLIARLELIIGTAHLIAETGGIANRPFVAPRNGRARLLCRHVQGAAARGRDRLRAYARRTLHPWQHRASAAADHA